MRKIATMLVVSCALLARISLAVAAEDKSIEEHTGEEKAATEKAAVTEPAVVKPAILTQSVFATRLIQDLNLGSLPKKPKDRHLLTVLGGKRSFVFEAEEQYDKKTDNVVVRPYNAIGEFSGKGWLHVGTESTPLTFRARMPLAGVYRMKVKGAGDGHLWSIAGRAIKMDFGPTLKEVDAGTVILDAEMMVFTAILPPGGAVDTISFYAADLPAIQPGKGWQLEAPLTYGAAAEVTALLLKDSLKLHDAVSAKPRIVPVAGTASLPAGVSLVTDLTLGRFFGDAWFRNGYTPAKLEFPFSTEDTSLYGVRVFWAGSQFVGVLDGVAVNGTGKGFLDWVDLGIHHLKAGKHILQVDMPPSSGINAIELTAKASGVDLFLTMLDWPQKADQVVPPEDLERLLKDIGERYQSSRKK